MNNVETTNRNTLLGMYLDYTEYQLHQMLVTHTDMINRNGDVLSKEETAAMMEAHAHIAMAVAKIGTIMPEHRTPDNATKRCPGCGEFDTFSGKYCADCTGNFAAVSGPNPQF